MAVLVGCVAALAVAGTAPLWSGHVFVESRLLSVVLLSVGIAGFCLHATLLGVLAGVNRWTEYGTLIVGDAADAGGGRDGHLPRRLGPRRLPLGDGRRVDRVAGAAAGLARPRARPRDC